MKTPSTTRSRQRRLSLLFGPLSLSLALSSQALPAQSVTATPRGLGLETQEGGDQLAKGWTQGRATVFGGYAEARFQYHDDELNDNTPRVLQWLGFRHDAHAYHAGSGTGRTWQDVQLRLGEASWATLSSKFQHNLGAAKLVFSGSVTWPQMNGLPAQSPAALHPGLRFPFAQPYFHAGRSCLVQDFQFRTGSLHSGTWPSNKAYQLDGLMVVDNMITPAAMYPASDAGCHDPGYQSKLGATIEASYRQYSKLHPSRPHSVELRFRSKETAIGKPYVQALALGGKPLGLDLGARCNKLYLDLAGPVAFFAGSGGASPWQQLSAPRSPAVLALEFWMQAAWADSVDGRFSLTRAAQAAPPPLGMTDLAPRKQMLIAFGAGSAGALSGALTGPGHHLHHPISFYGH